MAAGAAPRSAAAKTPMGSSFGAAFALHVAFVAALILFANRSPSVMPPVYRVNILAAPPGPRAVGIIPPTPPATPEPPPPEPVTPPPLTQPPPVSPTFTPQKPQPVEKPKRATPTTQPPPKTQTPQPIAGGGPQGGTGTDVATVQLDQGIDFPFPSYLNNIVRQVALNFKPDDPNTGLHAVVFFLIHRDGHVDGYQFRTRSGDYAFDLEARGAIEHAASAFGPLPADFHDDVLPVYFSFDPRLLH